METSLEFINCQVCGEQVKKKSVNHVMCFKCMMAKNDLLNKVLEKHVEINKLILDSYKNDVKKNVQKVS